MSRLLSLLLIAGCNGGGIEVKRTLRTVPMIVCAALFGGCHGDQPLGDGDTSVKVAITAVSPPLVPSEGGVEVTLSGKNLPAGAEVLINGAEPPGLAWRDAGRMTFVSPPLAVGSYDVVVRAAGSDLVAEKALRAYASTLAFAEEPAPFVDLNGPLSFNQTVRWRIGDIDGDGHDDVVFWKYDGNGADAGSTTVYLADGHGGSRQIADIPHQPGPQALADVDGDGDLDLVDDQGVRLFAAGAFGDALQLANADEGIAAAAVARAGTFGFFYFVATHTDGTGRLARAQVSGGALTVTPVRDLPFTGSGLGNNTLSAWYTPNHLAVLDLDGDGNDDIAYLAADRAVILKGPDFLSDWEVPGTFNAIQSHRSDVDGDGRNELVVANGATLSVIVLDDTGSPQVTDYPNLCGLNVVIRGFAPGADGVMPDSIGVQCPQEFLVLQYFKQPKPQIYIHVRFAHHTASSSVVGTGGTLSFDTPEQVLPRFARLDSGTGIEILDGNSSGEFAGTISGWYYDDLYGFSTGVPTYPSGETVRTGGGGIVVGDRLIGVSGNGMVTARGAKDPAPLTLDLAFGTKNLLTQTHCDLDGDGVQDLALGVFDPNDYSTEVRTVLVKPDRLVAGDTIALPYHLWEGQASFDFAVRALDADGDGRCDLWISAVDQSPSSEAFWIHDASGAWHENTIDTPNLPYVASGYPLGYEQFMDADGDGDDDIIAWTAGQPFALWVGENQGAQKLVWTQPALPADAGAPYSYVADMAVHDGKIWLSQQQPQTLPYWGRFIVGHLDAGAFVIDAITDKVSYGGGPLLFADFDGDGTDDLFTYGQVSRRVPGAGLEPAVSLGLPHGNLFAAALDLDGDGLADVAALTADGGLIWAHNRSH